MFYIIGRYTVKTVPYLLSALLFFFGSNAVLYSDAGHTRCGTFHISGNNIQSLEGIDSIRIYGMQRKTVSPSGNFLIHYDIENHGKYKNSVPTEDSNANGIPDFVDSVAYYFDYVHNFYKQTGYKSVYPDDSTGSSLAYDIYLLDLGKEGFYGLTYPGTSIPGKWKYPRRYSFIVIDNNFSPLDSVDSKTQTYKKYKPEEFVKITAAHELHHAVQSLYGNTFDRLIHEMSSTSMEVRLFPEITDYVQFIKSLFTNPDQAPFGKGIEADDGYKYAIWGEYLYKKFGDEIQRKMWLKVSQDINTYQALDEALKEAGSGLGVAWCEFMEWIYHTGKRAIAGKYFDYAAEYPEIPTKPEYVFEPPSGMVAGSLYAYEFRFFRYCFPGNSFTTGDTLDVIVTSTDLFAAVNNKFEPQYKKSFTYSCVNNYSPGYIRIGSSDYSYVLICSSDSMCHKVFQSNGAQSQYRNTAFPNPFKPAIHETLFIPTPENAVLFSSVNLSILDASLNTVYSGKYPVGALNNYRGVLLNDLPDNISSGVYIYIVRSGDEELSGKFTLIR